MQILRPEDLKHQGLCVLVEFREADLESEFQAPVFVKLTVAENSFEHPAWQIIVLVRLNTL